MTGKLKKLSEKDVQEAIIFYQSGLSLADIGKIFCVSRQSIWDLLRRRIKLRDNRRYGEENHFYRGGTKSCGQVHDRTEKAINRRQLINPRICSKCGFSGKFKDGRTAIQAHHDDYNKPLEVRWLCQKCHHDWHKNNKAIERSGSNPSERSL